VKKKLPRPLQWWRRLPQKTRIRLIAGIFLILAGTEAVVLAPQIFEMAFLIDALGFTFVAGAALLSLQIYLAQIRQILSAVFQWLTESARTKL